MYRLQHLFQLTPGATLAPARGLRTAVAFGLALLVLAAVESTPFGGAVGLGLLLGVLFTSFCDLGASARGKIVAMCALTLGGPLVVAVGRSLAPPWWLAGLLIFLVTVLVGFLPAYGPQVNQVGLLSTVLFVAALGIGGGPARALPSALGFLLGGAMVLLLTFLSCLPGSPAQEPSLHEASARASPQASRSPARAPLPVWLDARSPLFRQALVRALEAGGVGLFTWGLRVPYPQWAPIAVIVCVRPEKEASVLAAVQYVTGTVLGVLFADLLIANVPSPLVIALILVVGVGIAFTVKDLNFALFTFFLTNLLLLLLSLAPPGVSHIRLRVFAVLLGAGMALVVTFLMDWVAHRQRPRANTTA